MAAADLSRVLQRLRSAFGRFASTLSQGFDTVEVETGKDGVVDPDRDTGNAALVDKEIADIEAGKVFLHTLGLFVAVGVA